MVVSSSITGRAGMSRARSLPLGIRACRLKNRTEKRMEYDIVDTRLAWLGLLVFTVTLLTVATEIGFRLGRQQPAEGIDAKKAHVGVLLAALLALIGLLLAFSFNIVERRYSARKTLVLDEANAIGTTYLRAELLPQPYAGAIEDILREYVAIRLAPSDPKAIQDAIERSAELHDDLWKETIAMTQAQPPSVVVVPFIYSLNQLIDLHEMRVTVNLYQRLPTPILLTLYTMSTLAMALLGFSSGLTRWRMMAPTIAVTLAISLVIVLIVEMDRPLSRVFQISQQALVDVQTSMRAK
jgi:hypothetical protein